MTARLLLSAALLAACAKSVLPELEARQAATLGPPPEVPANWQPDAVLTLTGPIVRELIEAALATPGVLDHKIPLAGSRTFIQPKLVVDELSVGASARCATCLEIDATVSGEVSWQIANSSGAAPISGILVLDAELEALEDDRGFAIYARPRDVRSSTLEIGGRTFATVRTMAEGALRGWVRQELGRSIPPIRIATLPSEGLPLRAARARPFGDGARVELLSRDPKAGTARGVDPAPGEAWTLAVAPSALLHIARVHAFEHGPVSHGVIVEPTGLEIAGSDLTLGLRLWRTTGRGWWRDVLVTGTVEKTRKGFALKPEQASEIDRSKGARLVDPLAALVEGRILRAIEGAVATALPGGHDGQIGGVKAEVSVDRIDGSDGAILLAGTLALDEATPARRRQSQNPASAPESEGGRRRSGGAR